MLCSVVCVSWAWRCKVGGPGVVACGGSSKPAGAPSRRLRRPRFGRPRPPHPSSGSPPVLPPFPLERIGGAGRGAAAGSHLRLPSGRWGGGARVRRSSGGLSCLVPFLVPPSLRPERPWPALKPMCGHGPPSPPSASGLCGFELWSGCQTPATALCPSGPARCTGAAANGPDQTLPIIPCMRTCTL